MEEDILEKWNTLKNKSNTVFNYVFFVLFCFITISAATVIFKDFFVVFFTALTIFILFCIGGYIYKYDKLPSSKQVNIVFAILLTVMIILQVIIGYNLVCTPLTDWKTIDIMSRNFAETGSFDNIYSGLPEGRYGYMARYPNNNGSLIMLSFYNRLVYLIFGYVPLYAPVALNTLCITVAVIFTFLIAKKIFNPMGTLITSVFCFMFLPYYTYTAYYYSDSLSIPFVPIAVYFIILGAKAANNKLNKRIICLIIAAVSISFGYTIKGSILVILAGAIVYIALENKFKQALISILCIVLAFGVTTVGIKTLSSSMHFTSKEELYEEQYPINHWIMMGLKGDGGFNQEDTTFTRQAGNYDEKKSAINKEIANRLNEMGFDGMVDHLSTKLAYTWGDGTYFISNHLNIYENDGITLKTEYNPLFEFVLQDGKYYEEFSVYSNTQQMIMLIFMLLSAYYSIRRKKITSMTLIQGIVFGVALFFMVWETRSRYIFNFTPMFILLASGGINVWMSRAQLLFSCHKKKCEQLENELSTANDIL